MQFEWGNFQRLLRARMKPLKREFGFAWNESGWSGDSIELRALFDADARVFVERVPGFFVRGLSEKEIGCVDLWIHLDRHGPSLNAFLEGIDVSAWLRSHGFQGVAAELSDARDVETSIEALVRGIALMLEEIGRQGVSGTSREPL